MANEVMKRINERQAREDKVKAAPGSNRQQVGFGSMGTKQLPPPAPAAATTKK
jgi:hypothetical protein